MAHHLISSPDNDPELFGERVYFTAYRLAQTRFERGSDAGAHDIAMLVFLQFWTNPARWMATYSPDVFAAVALSNRAEDWRRSERIQRGQGAHLITRNGVPVARREMASFDAIVEHIGETIGSEHDVADSASTTIIVNDALNMLTDLQQTLLWRVDHDGYTVVEAAADLGKSRAYCQRELGKAREFIRAYVTAA